MDTISDYARKRDALTEHYRSLQDNGGSVRLQKSSASNLFRKRDRASGKLDVRGFNRVVSINPKTFTAEVEGMTPYRAVVDATLRYGLLPAVVPELATITVGGAVSGGGIESSSFRYGLVHETVLAMDILLPTGEVVTATPDNEYQDLFYGVANSFGTFGYVLKVTIKLVKAAPYVRLEHERFETIETLMAGIEQIATSGQYKGKRVDFMDAVGFDADQLYMTRGYFEKTAPVDRVSNYRYMKPYFPTIRERTSDYLTAEDYIWRWDSDWFWCSKNFYMNRQLPRFVLGKWLLKSEAYWRVVRWDQRYQLAAKLRAFQGDKTPREDVIQDIQVRIEKAPDFWHFFTKNLTIRPVWLCPTRSATTHQFPFYELDPDQTYINFGFWDQEKARPDDPHYYNKLIEGQVSALGGKKGLYSESFYTEEAFWKLYDGKRYRELKARYDPKGRLRDLYQKTVQRG